MGCREEERVDQGGTATACSRAERAEDHTERLALEADSQWHINGKDTALAGDAWNPTRDVDWHRRLDWSTIGRPTIGTDPRHMDRPRARGRADPRECPDPSLNVAMKPPAKGSGPSMIYRNNTLTVGGTPMVELGLIAKGLPGRVVAKLEMRNPCGSVKDRVGVAMIEDAERRGALAKVTTLVEATGGNTGIALAFAAAVRGLRLVLTMPETMSVERVALLRHLGAEVVLTPGILMGDAIERARELLQEIPGSMMLDQFKNPANVDVHRRTTSVEIWEDTQGTVDVFVSAVGTGGTITGVGQDLKRRKPSVRVVAVEPAGAAVLSGKPAGNHHIPGIGVGFIPDILDRSILDEVIAVGDADAFRRARQLARVEGILAGISSGAALHAALEVASREATSGKTIVVLFADGAERYVTTSLFATHQEKAPAPR